MNLGWKRHYHGLAILGVCVMVVACTRHLVEITPKQDSQLYQIIDFGGNRDVDILFVIDNSGSMEVEQKALVDEFDSFITQLEALEGGLPNVHIGVITTDIGLGGSNPACSDNGHNGILQNGTQSAGCSGPQGDRYIQNIANEDGTRTTNYPENQTLKETFSCIARVGVHGCGFEQPLESMRRALDGSRQQNLGFLREDALLAIIFVTDEDDCSVEDTTMFEGDYRSALDSPLGAWNSFRCFDFGVLCNEPTRTAGIKTNCKPHPNSPYMYAVQEYIDFVFDLKADASKILIAGIVGKNRLGSQDSAEVLFVPGNFANASIDHLELKKGCGYDAFDNHAGAIPAIRLEHFVNAFPQQVSDSICSADFTTVLNDIGEKLRIAIGEPCQSMSLFVDADPITEGLQVDCTVSDINESARDQTIIHPQCASGIDLETVTEPCWRLCQHGVSSDDALYCETDHFSCTARDKVAIQVFPSEREIRTDDFVVVKCAIQ